MESDVESAANPAAAASSQPRARDGKMPTTLWTVVLNARDLGVPNAQAALAKLCEIYWYPLYAFVRRQGYQHHQAEDLTQGFFEHLFVKQEWLRGVAREKGRFRTFLLCSLSNFLVNRRAHENAEKRGGGPARFVSWDPELGEALLARELIAPADPGKAFDRLWACALVERAISMLKQEYDRCGKLPAYDALSPYLTQPVPPGTYGVLSLKLGMTEGALRTAMSRLINRFADFVREQVAQTVGDRSKIDEELRDVLEAWSTPS